MARAEHVWYKGIDTCAAAVRSLAHDHRVAYRIAGAGAGDASALPVPVTEAQAQGGQAANGSSIVDWLGELGEDELLDEYRRASVVVLVSRFRAGRSPAGEGLGLAVLEGGAVGVPGIGSAIGGTSDCIVDGATGYLIPPDDVDTLESRLRMLIEDPSLRQSMAENAHAWVAEHFSPEAFSASLGTALAAALLERRPPLRLRPQA